jgi:hypothetical protein
LTIIIFCYFSVLFHIFLTIKGLDSNLACTLTAGDQKYEYLCYTLMRFSTCRHYQGAVSHQMTIDLQTESEAFFSVQCSQDLSQSEFRVLLDFLTIFSLFKTFSFSSTIRAQSLEIKIFYYFLSIQHLLTSASDYSSLVKSSQFNYSKCSGHFPEYLGSGVFIKSSSCSYTLPFFSVLFGLFKSLSLFLLTFFQPLLKTPKPLKNFE